MGRKGKEPAGLRRWRLAHKKRKTRSRPRKVRMLGRRRYGRKRKGGRTSRAVPLLMTMPVIVPAMKTYSAVGLTASFPEYMLWQTTGYSMTDGKFNKTIVMRQLGTVVAGMIGHKIANRMGINKHIKKLTFGYLQL